MSFKVPEPYRVRRGPRASNAAQYGNNGAFILPPINPLSPLPLRVIASDGGGWEHVSVSLEDRCPTWEEMCHVKGLFWDAEDCVMQLHPPQSQWVNNHPHCLHLWRPLAASIPLPPSIFVGVQSAGVLGR